VQQTQQECRMKHL